jgi:3-oxoacyl-(acyl-carrier-protein) synthase
MPPVTLVALLGKCEVLTTTTMWIRKEAKRMDRFAQFAVAASLQALQDSRLVIDALNADDIGVLIGTGVGGIKVLEDQQEIYSDKRSEPV